MSQTRTCRFCKQYGDNLLKYGRRHYAHAKCGLGAQGPAFLDNFTDWQLAQFPYFVALDYGVGERIEAAYTRQQS